MPKLSANALPAYRLHKQSGQAIVTLNGRDFPLGKYDTPESRAKYERLTAECIANGRRLAVPQEECTVAVVLASFWSHATSYYVDSEGKQAKERENYRHVIALLNRLYGSTPVASFGPLALKGCARR